VACGARALAWAVAGAGAVVGDARRGFGFGGRVQRNIGISKQVKSNMAATFT
jgi:hypothetical protein